MPFRKKNGFLKNKKQVFKTTFGAGAIIFSFALLLRIQSGIPERLPPDARALSSYDTYWHFAESYWKNILGDKKSDTTILIYGDSHAQQLITLLDQILGEFNLNGEVYTLGGTPPLIGMANPYNHDKFEKNALEKTLKKHSITDVFLIANWRTYIVNSAIYCPGENSKSPLSIKESVKKFKIHLEKTIRLFKKEGVKNIWILKEIPQNKKIKSLHTFGLNAWKGIDLDLGDPLSTHRKDSAISDLIFKEISSDNAVHILDSSPLFFQNRKTCLVVDKKSYIPLYRGAHHLTSDGAKILSPLFKKVFNEISSRN